MKSKASLLLMEQLVAVLVFALAAVLCLRLFAGAERISTETARRDQAVAVAQNAAELLKAGMAPEEADSRDGQAGYELQITEADSGISGLRCMNIDVLYENTPLFSLTVGVQEVSP